MDDSEYLRKWNKFMLYMDLYKFYHSITVNVMIFGSALVGGLFAFYIQHQNINNAKYILLFLSVILFLAGALAVTTADVVASINKRIKEFSFELGINPCPTTMPLKYILLSVAVLSIVSAITIVSLFQFH